MKFHKAAIALFSISALALSTNAFANEHDKKVINERQHNQNERIDQGVKSGELTPQEAARLRSQQQGIERYEHKSKADGPGLTKQEAQHLDKMQDRQSHAIHNQKHDNQQHH